MHTQRRVVRFAGASGGSFFASFKGIPSSSTRIEARFLSAKEDRSSKRATGSREIRTSSILQAESIEVVLKREQRKKQERAQLFNDVCGQNGIPTFLDMLGKHNCLASVGNDKKVFSRFATQTLQINIGKLCNQTCQHCHVEAGPTRTLENMDDKTVDRVIQLLDRSESIKTVDITGGAPELNPHFRRLVLEARKRGKSVIDRCNLTVFFEPKMEDIPQFLAENSVEVVASLPCYTVANVDKQRGKGVFDKSVRALQILNKLGYGDPHKPHLKLNLVYNPGGTNLPGPQPQLEADYKAQLKEHMGIVFNTLYTLTNMPVKRWADFLFDSGQYGAYMSLLVNNFNKDTVDKLMCRDLVSVSWDGRLYDCDFNQMLEIELGAAPRLLSQSKNKKNNGSSLTVWDVESFDALQGQAIATDRHCFGCTAGAGSSCGGTLVA